MSIALCSHIKSDNTPCGSPALRHKKFCYFHHREHKRQTHAAKVLREINTHGPRLPRLRNLANVQESLYLVMTAIVDDGIDLRHAWQRLAMLQKASNSLTSPPKVPNTGEQPI